MATKKKFSPLNAFLAFVRGPAFLGVLSFVLLLAILPAQATLLRGYLSTDEANGTKATGQGGSDQSDGGGIPQNAEAGKSAAALESQQAQSVNGTDANSVFERAMVAADSFPPTFMGAWKCVTVVVASAVNTVPVGQKVESEVDFVRQNDGRVLAHWEQSGWSEARANVQPLSDREATMDRTNYYTQEMNGAWQARSHDRYYMVDGNRIAATSQVEQYIDGQFLGRYKTSSVLYRLSGNMAYDMNARNSVSR